MRQFLCECQECKAQNHLRFYSEPYPVYRDKVEGYCDTCKRTTEQQRVLTRRTLSEMHRLQAEKDLRQSIVDRCAEYGFKCRFLYQSVVITTPLADWSFDYHQSKKTLYHESTVKINFNTGGYCKTHCQFRNRKIKPLEVIDYIAGHDAWRAKESNHGS